MALSPAASVKPTGTVTVKEGARVLARGTLAGGAKTLTLPALRKGAHRLTVVYGGSSNTSTKNLAFSITQK